MPKLALDELKRLRKERETFQQYYEERERACVLEARKKGLPWEEIAQALGRTRSAMWQKYHQVAEAPASREHLSPEARARRREQLFRLTEPGGDNTPA